MTSSADPRFHLEPAWSVGLPRPPAWQDAGGREVWGNPWFAVTEHQAVAPTGASATYAVSRPRNRAVGVLPIHPDGRVTLVAQNRFPLANWSWEMPEGGCPADEDPFDAIRRELAEEAGLVAATWVEALTLELSNSVTDEIGFTWLAWDFTVAPLAPDPTEALVRADVPFRDLLAEIDRGAVRDALTVATALKAERMARDGRLPAELARALLGA